MNPIPLLVKNSILRFYTCSPGPHFTPWIFYNATPLVGQGVFQNVTSRMKHTIPQVTCPALSTVGLSHPSIWVHSAHDELKHKCEGETLHFTLYILLPSHISVHQMYRLFPTLSDALVPAKCPTIHSNSDTIYTELLQIPQVKDSVLQDCATFFRCQSQAQVSTCVSDRWAISQGSPYPLLQFD